MKKILKHSNNNNIFKLKKGKQQLYGLIYSSKLIKLKILKIYIKINLANSFISYAKFFIDILILFH